MGKLNRAIILGIITRPLCKAVGASDPSGHPRGECWRLSWKCGSMQADQAVVTYPGGVPASLPFPASTHCVQGAWPGAVAGAAPIPHSSSGGDKDPVWRRVSNVLPDYQQAPGQSPRHKIKREGERRRGGCCQPCPAALSTPHPAAPRTLLNTTTVHRNC